MATYIKDDSLDRLNQTLQFLAQESLKRRAINLDEEQLYNRQGINTSGWTANGAFAGQTQPDIALKERKQEQYNVNADQGGILAQIKRENPDMYNYMTRQEQVPSGLLGLYAAKKQNIDPFKQSDAAGKFASQINTYKESEKVNAPIRKENAGIDAYNRKAETINANKPNYREKYEGNEVDQQQQLLKDTRMRIRNNGGIDAYMAYLTTGKAIADHYGHSFQPYPVEFFGMGGKSGSGGGKTERYAITLNSGKEVSVELPKGHDPDSEVGQKLARQKLKLTKDDGWMPGAWNPLSSDSTYMNSYEKEKAKQAKLENSMAEDSSIEKEINKRDGVFTSRSTAEKEYLADLASKGFTIYTDPATGYRKIVPASASANNTQQQQQQQNNSYKNLWRKK